MKHYLNCVGSIDDGSNFDHSMVKRSNPYWGLGRCPGVVKTINADLAAGETVVMWLRAARKSCKKKYGDERFIGAFILKGVTERQLGPLIALDLTNDELGWKGDKWKFIIHYHQYFDISALGFGNSDIFGLSRYPQSSLCCLNTMASLEKNRKKVLAILDNLFNSLNFLGCVIKY